MKTKKSADFQICIGVPLSMAQFAEFTSKTE